MKNSECDGKTKHHLNDLETGGEDGKHLGHPDPHGSEGVVGVHDGVDRVVHHHEESAWGGKANVGVEADPHDGDVVIPVQEDQILFPQDDEGCVKQFHHLWKNK